MCAGADERRVGTARLWLAAEALLEHGWSVVFPEPVMTGGEIRLPEAVRRVLLRPLARYLHGFDVAVAVAGHTLTHELIAAKCPALLIPFVNDPGDAKRAAGARDRGLALALDEMDGGSLAAGVGGLSDETVRHRLRQASAELELRDAGPQVVEELMRVTQRFAEGPGATASRGL